MNVLVLLGSLRDGSTNRTLAEVAVAHLPEGATTTWFNRGADLPHYSEDLDVEGSVPQVATELREAVAAADALIVVTPEYNGTLSSVVEDTFGIGASYEAFSEGRLVDGEADAALQALVARLGAPVAA